MRSALGVVLLALVVASMAAAAPTARVTITDSQIQPVRVRVDARGSVSWVNAGTQSHRVASRDGSFSAFTLAPRATRAVRFTRNGRHPYSPPSTQAPEFRLPDTTEVDPDVGTLTIDFTRRTGARRTPAGELAVGRGFTIQGTHTSQETTCEGSCSGTLTITQRYVATFRPRR